MIVRIVLFSVLSFVITGCVDQPPAPVIYNHDKNFTNKKLLQSQLSRPHSKESSKINSIIKNDKGEIINKSVNKQTRNFDRIVSSHKKPTANLDSDSDEIIIVPQIKLDNSTIIYHTVQEGETLALIANNYDQTVEELVKLNNISPPYRLNEFQIIEINVSKKLLNKKNKGSEKNLFSHNQKTNQIQQVNKFNFIKPIEGKIITRFGQQTSYGKSKGINIAASDGIAIKSIASGTIIYVGNDIRFGNLLIIKLDNCNLYVVYAHLQDLIMQKGEKVVQGKVLGHVGHTGNVGSPQLYLAIRQNKIAVDPLKYIPN